MTQRRATTNGPALLSVGVVFLAVGIVFMVTGIGSTWIPFFTLGVVFLSIGVTGLVRKAKNTAEQPHPPEVP